MTSIGAKIELLRMHLLSVLYREGRKPTYRKEQIQHALSLLDGYSYSQVVELTGISKSTLTRAKKNLE